MSYAVIFLNDIVYWNLDESWHMVKEIFLWHIKNLGKEFGDHYSCKRKYKGNSMYISHWLDAKCPIWWVEVISWEEQFGFPLHVLLHDNAAMVLLAPHPQPPFSLSYELFSLEWVVWLGAIMCLWIFVCQNMSLELKCCILSNDMFEGSMIQERKILG